MPTLADEWNQLLTEVPASPADETPTEEDRRIAAAIIERIRTEVPKAGHAKLKFIEVGEFRQQDLLRQLGDKGVAGEYWVGPGDVKGVAKLVHAFCVDQGLHLYVGGEYKMGPKTYAGPFVMKIYLKRASD